MEHLLESLDQGTYTKSNGSYMLNKSSQVGQYMHLSVRLRYMYWGGDCGKVLSDILPIVEFS